MNERIRIFASRLFALFRSKRLDRELHEELEFHLGMLIRKNLEDGMQPEAARRTAFQSLGGLDQVKEDYREKRSLQFLEDFMRDMGYAVRMLFNNPIFTLAAVLTLSLGIGANTAIFSIVNAVLLRPLSFSHPEEFVKIKLRSDRSEINFISAKDFAVLSRHAGNLSGAAAYTNIEPGTLTSTEDAERVIVDKVTPGFFRLLDVHPQIGRDFGDGDDNPGGILPVLLSNSFWGSYFNRRDSIIGQSLRLDGLLCVVVGILPASFVFPTSIPIDIWMPLRTEEKDKYSQMRFVNGIGRLRPTASLQKALAAKHLIASLLFGVSATDAFIFIGTALFVIVTTLIAGCIPAYRASTIKPSRSLRYE